jgi:hypothetical protein
MGKGCGVEKKEKSKRLSITVGTKLIIKILKLIKIEQNSQTLVELVEFLHASNNLYQFDIVPSAKFVHT